MNLKEYLLACLQEEASEIIKDTSKIQRFGPQDVDPRIPGGPTNLQELVVELNDLMGVLEMLVTQGILPQDWMQRSLIDRKIAKVTKYFPYSVSRGCLTLIDWSSVRLDKSGEPSSP